jgi:hypothetical protein
MARRNLSSFSVLVFFIHVPTTQGSRLFWKMGGAKNSAENKQRMLNSTTFCGFLLTKSVCLRLSARIYHEVLKNVV